GATRKGSRLLDARAAEAAKPLPDSVMQHAATMEPWRKQAGVDLENVEVRYNSLKRPDGSHPAAIVSSGDDSLIIRYDPSAPLDIRVDELLIGEVGHVFQKRTLGYEAYGERLYADQVNIPGMYRSRVGVPTNLADINLVSTQAGLEG